MERSDGNARTCPELTGFLIQKFLDEMFLQSRRVFDDDAQCNSLTYINGDEAEPHCQQNNKTLQLHVHETTQNLILNNIITNGNLLCTLNKSSKMQRIFT